MAKKKEVKEEREVVVDEIGNLHEDSKGVSIIKKPATIKE